MYMHYVIFIHINEFGISLVHLLFHVILSRLHKFYVILSCLHIVGGKRIIIFQFRNSTEKDIYELGEITKRKSQLEMIYVLSFLKVTNEDHSPGHLSKAFFPLPFSFCSHFSHFPSYFQ